MIYSTIVEKNESALQQIIEALDLFEKERFVAGIQAGRFSKYEIEQTLEMVQLYQKRMNVEGRALAHFSETFIRQFATDNNQCFRNAEKYFRRIRSTLCALKKVFQKTCKTSRKQLPAEKEAPSVFDRSPLASNVYQLDMYGLESYDDMVQQLYNDLDTLLSTATGILNACQRVIEQEDLVREDTETLRSIYQESCNSLMCSVQEFSNFMNTTKTLPENELIKRRKKASSKDEFLKKEYHNVNKSEFKTYVWLVAVNKGQSDGLTSEETYLWHQNHDKVEEVRRVISLFYRLPAINGQEGKLNGQVIVEFIKWCGVEKDKEKRLYRYFCDNYRGYLKPLVWSSVCKKRKELKVEDHLTDEELIESFERRLSELTDDFSAIA